MVPEPDPPVAAAAGPAAGGAADLWQERLERAGALGPSDPTLVEHLALPLLRHLERRLETGRAGRRPLLALNGPVGAGKTSLGGLLERLAALGGIRLAVVSIDDLYLPSDRRRRVLAGNPFGVSRVPPGSHDVPLLLEALAFWRTGGSLRLPRFDKTLAGGEGERSGWRERQADAVVIEGWLMGCRALGPARLAKRIARGAGLTGLTGPELEWLPYWDRQLTAYTPLWQACDGLWLLRPRNWSLPRRWRFQAEARQRRGGGGWLSGSQLEALVRATLHSLPPALYQDPLLEQDPLPEQDPPLEHPPGATPGEAGSLRRGEGSSPAEPLSGPPLLGGVVLDARRRARPLGAQLCSPASSSSAIG